MLPEALLPQSLAEAVRLATALYGFATILWAAEYLALRRHFGGSALLSWEVGALRYDFPPSSPAARLLDRLGPPAVARALVATRLATGIALVALAAAGPAAVPSGALLLLSGLAGLLFAIRSPQGQEGSDQILYLLAFSLGPALLIGTAAALNLAALFLAAQMVLCYTTAGFSKLLAPEWRSGAAIRLVFRTNMYGFAPIHRLASQSPAAARAMAWSVIGFECLFPVVFLLPAPLGQALLLVPLAFHLATALFMGLNGFFLAFLAVYPVLYALLGNPVLR